MTSIGKDSTVMYFGEGLILSSLTAEGLSFFGDYPTRDPLQRNPKPRPVTVEGYIAATAESPEDRLREVTLTRDTLSRITSPDGVFFMNIDGRIAHLTDGSIIFKRSAPFSGKNAECFTLTANLCGGYFTGPPVTVHAIEETDGFHFPLTDGLTPGVTNGNTTIRLHNGGDIPVGFTAEFSPVSTVHSFSLECAENGKSITAVKDFGSGDLIRISTHRESLCFELIRGGNTYDLAGFADAESELFTLPMGDCTLRVGAGDPFEGWLTYTEAFVSF